ncbi:MAG: hypothetical protein K2L59_01275, partial [Muribaculaceae bacterium]|nr:hypothetical protein [Muribaculaceae bacterium]
PICLFWPQKYIYNTIFVNTLSRTVIPFLHEGMGHDGLRMLFPTKELLDNALDELYNASTDAIKADIDARAKRMYGAETDRIFREKQAAHDNVADANANYYTDMAEAHAEANARREQMKRDATEEYGANVAGKVGEKGFEKMTAEEQTFWGKLKGLLQKAFENLLRGLKIPKMRKWTDKQWSYIYHKAYKMKKAKGKMSLIDEAEDITMRRRTGYDAGSSVTWKEKAQALTDTKKPIQEETYNAPKDSRMPHQKDAALDSRSESDSAKVRKICESLNRLEKKIPDEGLGKSEIVYQIASALGISNASSSKSNYEVVTIPGQGKTTFRVSNHSAEVNNFGQDTNNVGIVVKTSRHRFNDSEDVDYVEFLYYGDKADGNPELQRNPT